MFGAGGVVEPRLERVNKASASQIADVVFVHGLGGSGRNTWVAGSKGKDFWPRWFAEDLNADSDSIAVSLLDYPAEPLVWFDSGAADLGLMDRGQGLLAYLHSMKIGSRPLAFVTHSLGGLVVKQILRSACDGAGEEWSLLSKNTKCVVFVATPHGGSGLANFAKLIGASTIASQLDKNNV